MDEKLLTKKPEKKTALISFSVETLRRIDQHSKRLGVSRTRFVEFALKDALDQLDKGVKK